MNRKLLLADDSVTIQRVVELTFSGEDIDVISVGDGEQAIARMTAEAPDIVLADIAMPKKNGYEVAAFVKEHPTLSKVPVLLLAGAFEPVDEERARRVNCAGVLVKPFETHEVIARVRELIDGERRSEPAAPTASVSTAPAAPASPAAPKAPVAPVPVAAAAPAPAPPPRPPAPVAVKEVVQPPPQQEAPADESLDAYFDRLDVAFAARAQNPPRPFPHLAPPAAERHETSVTTPIVQTATDAEPRNVIADLFHALLAVEQGDRDPDSIRVPEEIERIRRGNTIE